MKTIWRVEDIEGHGMYMSSLCVPEMEACYGENHPSPYLDTELGYDAKEDSTAWRFGFETLTQFKAWCHTREVRAALHKAGFRLVRYRVPDQFHERSKFQAIFRYDCAERVGSRQVNYCDKRQL
jgi:hypothetical protein